MRQVTMREVAQKAQVSIRTVSRVINTQGEITETTRQRVLAAIEELGYRPSKVARALVTRRSDTIGLIVSDIANPFFSEVARAVQSKANVEGYDVFFCNSSGSWEEELRALDSLSDHAVDGIIVYPSPGLTLERIRPFADRYHPIVTLAYRIAHPRISSVVISTRAGARQAVDYLVEKGHTTIAMLAGPAPTPIIHYRVQGYRDALLAHGLPFRDELVLAGAPVFERGRLSTRQLLSDYPAVSAIFAYNDLLALGAIRACHEMGWRVPDDCAVIGFDDIPPAVWSSPALTTVRVDKQLLGRRAVERLLEMLDAPDGEFSPLSVPAELVLRESA
jgi:LacI family transcriptional regulator